MREGGRLGRRAYVRVELAGVRFVGAASPSGYKSRCTAHMSSVGVEFVLKKRRSCAGTTASTVSFFFLRSSSSLCHSSAAERGESATVRRRARARHQHSPLSTGTDINSELPDPPAYDTSDIAGDHPAYVALMPKVGAETLALAHRTSLWSPDSLLSHTK